MPASPVGAPREPVHAEVDLDLCSEPELCQEDHDGKTFVVVAGNPSASDTATVVLERRSGGTWVALATAKVPPGGAQAFPRTDDVHVEGTGRRDAAAYRVTSDRPIAIYQFNPPFEDSFVSSSGASLLLTAAALGTRHFALTQRGYQDAYGAKGHSTVTVVAALDDTEVTVTAGADTAPGVGIPALSKGGTWTAVLAEGDVVQIAGATPAADLSGTFVSSSRPVSVFAGGDSTPMGPDHTEEPMPALEAWGKTFVATRVQDQKRVFPDEPTVFRVLASEDGTRVTMSGAPGLALPAPFTLDRGQLRQVDVAPALAGAGGFLIDATRPVLVTQTRFAAVLGVPIEQYMDDFFFVTLSYFTGNWITVIRKAGQPVALDGASLPDPLFRPAGGGFEAAEIAMKSCAGLICAHRIAGKQITVLAFADDQCAYGYVGAMALRCVNATAGCR